MPEHAAKVVSQRFVQRLAEGALRSRLVDPVLAARPPLVVISAPSGYGKTVLAAQMASSGAFRDVAWIRTTGAAGSIRDALAQIAEHLTGQRPTETAQALPDLCHMCSEELGALPDEQTLLVVVDDAQWAGDSESIRILEDVFSEAPMGTTAVVTTRADLFDVPALTNAWAITTVQLMLTDDEISEVWQRHAQSGLSGSQAQEVALASGRHAALVSLMARQAALSADEEIRLERTPNVNSLLQALVSEQLSAQDCLLLDYAAVLGQGTQAALTAVSGLANATEGLTRIAAALPLVSVTSGTSARRFVVHDLVSEACGSVQALLERDPAGLRRVIDELAESGAPARALEVAVESKSIEIVAESLRQLGSNLLKGAGWELVRRAMDELPASAVASDPTLLLVRAELAWVEGSKTDAIRQATLAVRLGELSADDTVPPSARSLLAGMRMSVADYQGAVSDLAPFLGDGAVPDNEDLADVLYAAIPAYAFLGDREGLSRSKRAALELIRSKGATGSRLARLEMAMGIVADFADGDHEASTLLLAQAASREDVPQHWRAVALANSAASSLESGDLEYSRAANLEAATISSSFSTPLDRALQSLVSAVGAALIGEQRSVRSELERVLLASEQEDEAFALATVCSIGTQCSLALGDIEYARRLCDRGLAASSATGSPVLLWLAELVRSMTALAIGDVDSARTVAERILPQATAIQAMGHVLHARLQLSEVALRSGDFAHAIEHLSALAEHVSRTSPVLTLASYIRVFPDLLGPIALAMGVEVLPERLFPLLNGPRGALALEQAAAVLSPQEQELLAARMRAQDERIAAQAQPTDEDAVCKVRLFGGLEVITPRGKIGDRDWAKRKSRLLFAMLVSRFGTDVPRGEIVEYLWPEMEEERALNNFYVVWSAMKRALSPDSVRDNPCPFVEHNRGVCRVVKGRVISDLEEFTELLGASRIARRNGDQQAELEALRGLVEVYRGEVLPGDVYDDWFAPLRDRFRHDFEDAMVRAAEILEGMGDPHGALQILRRAMAADPWREDLYQAQLRLQIAVGQRSAAIETYMHCRQHLTTDLGIDPSRETTALYEQVLGMEE